MTTKNNRRQFLKTSSAAAAAGIAMPYFFSGKPTLAFETDMKNDRVPIGLIGSGGMGVGNMKAASKWVDVVAFADADSERAKSANERLSQGKGDVYTDYQEILDRDDIKVLHIATPDHWHTKPLIEAMKAGKSIYCEKPLTLTIDEGKLIRKVQEETGAVVQVGTQQRSTFNRFVKAVAMVKDGRIGKIKKMTCGIGGAPASGEIPVAEVPSELDWDRWLGPAPKVDYRYTKGGRHGKSNCHYEFRWWYEYSGGKLTDWGAHHVDIATWAIAANGQSDSVVSIGGTAEHPVEFVDGVPQQHDRYNTATKFDFLAKFDSGVEMKIQSGGDNGILIEGDKGRIFVNRGKLAGAPVEALKDNPLPEDAIKNVYKGFDPIQNERKAHWANFLLCVDEKKEPISDVHTHMKMLNVCHLAGISARLGGKELKWDDKAEQIVGDDLANSMVKREYREGYEINMDAPKAATANS